jgi:hypothetical protein
MKQIKKIFDRFFNNQHPIKHKIQVRWFDDTKNFLILFHYHHVLLIYDIKKNESIYEWYEVKTDKAILDASKKYLNDRFEGENNENDTFLFNR